MTASILQRLVLEFFLDLFLFPLWWYSQGVVYWGKFCIGLLKDGNNYFSPGLWLTNIFVPMYGQYDIQGRLVSFLMRLAQVFFRGVGLVIWLFICLLFFLVWIILPFAILYFSLSK